MIYVQCAISLGNAHLTLSFMVHNYVSIYCSTYFENICPKCYDVGICAITAKESSLAKQLLAQISGSVSRGTLSQDHTDNSVSQPVSLSSLLYR